MGQVAVLGEASRTASFALAGATVIEAEDAAAARRAWGRLDPETVVVLLTPAAARALESVTGGTETVLTVVMPE